MELDKKALAVTRLVSAIYSWDANKNNPYAGDYERRVVLKELLDSALPTEKNKQNVINMILAMTLLTSANVETVRDPSKFNKLKAKPWSVILSGPSQEALKILGYRYYDRVTQQDYVNAKALLPVIGSSSMLEDEVMKVFSASGIDSEERKIGKAIERDFYKKGLGGFEFLYRGLSDMSDNAILLVTEVGTEWDMERGVSTSFDYRSAMGFSTKEGPNSILFILDNPKRKGFNALQLSKYKKEEEIILSGRIKINKFELTCTAKEVSSTNTRNKTWRIEFTENAVYMREGSRPFMMMENAPPEEVRKLIVSLFEGRRTKVTSNYGAERIITLVPKASEIKVYGTIL